MHVRERGEDSIELLHAFGERFAGAEHRRVVLHHALHVDTNPGRAARTLRAAQPVEPADCQVTCVLRQQLVRRAGLDRPAAVMRGRTTEHDEVQQ